MVCNWETGTKKPSPFYRERLCKLYNMTAEQLGFMDAPTLPRPNQPVRVAPVFVASSNGYYDARLIQPALPTVIPIPTPSIGVIPREQIKAIDLLSDGAEHTPDEQLSAWLVLGANHLSMLLDAGLSSEQVLDSLRVVMQAVQGLPGLSRRKLLELDAAALMSGIPLGLNSRVTEGERIQITETSMPLAVSYVRAGEYEASLDVATKATSLINRLNAPIMVRQLTAYLQHDLLDRYPDNTSVRSFVDTVQRQFPQMTFIRDKS